MQASMRWQLPDGAASRYEQILVPAILGPFARALVDHARLRRGDIVVDVGCGTGAAARYAATLIGPAGKVFGSDVDAAMIGVARSLPPVARAPIEWGQENACLLTLPDAVADVVLCAQTL
jgi:ubiquinone/menaquinone biosynthesis C-methylase UbiE